MIKTSSARSATLRYTIARLAFGLESKIEPNMAKAQKWGYGWDTKQKKNVGPKNCRLKIIVGKDLMGKIIFG